MALPSPQTLLDLPSLQTLLALPSLETLLTFLGVKHASPSRTKCALSSIKRPDPRVTRY